MILTEIGAAGFGGLFLFISTAVIFTKSSSLLRIAVERR